MRFTLYRERLLSNLVMLLLGVSCGAVQNVQNQKNNLPPAVTVQDGSTGQFTEGTLEAFKARGPSDLVFSATLEKSGGNGYILRLSWAFSGQKPSGWRVSGEQSALSPEGNPDPDQIELDNFQADGTVIFVSRPLQAGLIYWYDLNALVNEPGLRGIARLKTITVDLTGAVVP
jgi:hypothetical protein